MTSGYRAPTKKKKKKKVQRRKSERSSSSLPRRPAFVFGQFSAAHGQELHQQAPEVAKRGEKKKKKEHAEAVIDSILDRRPNSSSPSTIRGENRNEKERGNCPSRGVALSTFRGPPRLLSTFLSTLLAVHKREKKRKERAFGGENDGK